jgi:hypothetical protein
VRVLNPWQALKLQDSKLTPLDVLARDLEDNEFVVEMQTGHDAFFSKRTLRHYVLTEQYREREKIEDFSLHFAELPRFNKKPEEMEDAIDC